MKTVLFLIPSLGGGGAERVLVNLANNLDKTKYKVTVQTLFDVGVNRNFLNEDIEYIAGFKRQFPGNTKMFKLFSPETLYRKIVKKRYDIAVSYLEGPSARIIAGCPYKDTKKVSWIHVEQLSERALSHSFRSLGEARKCYGSFDATVCVAETVKQDFLQLSKIEHPCTVLYNTNEDEKILALSDEAVEDIRFSDNINVISIGRLRYEKGYDRLIKVHKRLLDEGFRHNIYVLGTGTEEERLTRLIEDYGVKDTFHLLGFKENPYKYVKQADLFVCSSRREGFSTAVTESLIIGTPVVSTCCSGAYELLGDSDEYGIVTENSEEGIFAGMREILSGGNLEYYKGKAVERGKFFSKENTVKVVENLFDSLLNEVE